MLRYERSYILKDSVLHCGDGVEEPGVHLAVLAVRIGGQGNVEVPCSDDQSQVIRSRLAFHHSCTYSTNNTYEVLVGRRASIDHVDCLLRWHDTDIALQP